MVQSTVSASTPQQAGAEARLTENGLAVLERRSRVRVRRTSSRLGFFRPAICAQNAATRRW